MFLQKRFAITYAKVLYFRQKYFAKTKSEFRENFREKTTTFVPTLISFFEISHEDWDQQLPFKLISDIITRKVRKIGP
jgi:hypothetical protein